MVSVVSDSGDHLKVELLVFLSVFRDCAKAPKQSMWRRECASAEPCSPLSSVTKASWHLRPSGRGPALKAAGRAVPLTLQRYITFPLLLISAANHVIFGSDSLHETRARCKRAKFKKKSVLLLQQSRKGDYKEKECQNGEPKLSQTAILKGFMSLSFSRLYEKLHFRLLFHITKGKKTFFFFSERIKSHAVQYYPHKRCRRWRR